MKSNLKTPTLSEFINILADRAKKNLHADGTMKSTFEEYLKFDKRLMEFSAAHKIDYDKLLVTEVTAAFVNNLFAWVDTQRNAKGKRYISKIMHSVIMKAEKEGYLNSNDFKVIDWHKDRSASSQKFNTLTNLQIQKFKELDLFKVSKSQFNELYRDLCVFLLYTGQSPCDAIALRYSDITYVNGVRHFVFKRRKIAERQLVPCAVPVSEEMEAIMNMWKWMAKDGYVFPIRSRIKICK